MTRQEHELFRSARLFANFLLSGMGWRGWEWSYNSIVYEIYFKEYYGITGTSFVRTELNNLADFQGSDHFLIAQVLLSADDQQQIDQYYDLISMPETRCFGDRALYRSK